MRNRFQMNPPATVLVGLAFLAGSNALPIGSGFAGISLAPGSLNSFYNQEVVIGNFPVNYGFSWTKDGTLEAGFRVETKINGRIVPLAIAVSGNTRDLRRTFKFEAGGRFLDSLSAVIYGDRDGLKWIVFNPSCVGLKTLHIVESVVGEVWALGAPAADAFFRLTWRKDNLDDLYDQEVISGDYSLKYGFSFGKDGNVATGFRILSKNGNKVMPVSFAVGGNVNDLRSTFKFEIGTRLTDSLSALLYGDRDGLRWVSSIWLPVENQGPVNGIGVSLEGNRANPVALSGGVGINDKVYQGRVDFDEHLELTRTNMIYLLVPINEKMRNSAIAILGFALVATCSSMPMVIDVGTGLDLTPGDTTFWRKDFVIGEQPIQVGLGWNKQDNTLAAGVKVTAESGKQLIPISAGLKGSINDIKSINYVVGANLEDTASIVLMGNGNNGIQYQLNGRVPVESNSVSSVGVSLVGGGEITDLENLSSVLTAGVGVGQQVIQGVVEFVGYEPSNVNLEFGANNKFYPIRKMNPATVAVFVLAFVATSLALPVGFNVGLDLKPGNTDFWKNDISIGGQKIQLGLGWNENGLLSAAAKMAVKVSDQLAEIPISAAITTSKDLQQIQYQVGSVYDDKLSAIVFKDTNGALQYQLNAKVPVKSEGSPVSAIGASLEGTGLYPTTLIGGVAVGKEVVQAKVDFVNYRPANVNVGIGADM
ncbi:hypothetical protein GE061_009433 [Apolygus lucorum]|uniref:Uncharacterized protein n=1 Tax=Apolygus lucorum TaxID=248454 RepID=A0A8S9Y054_APOLU|nr:hypothetical protein GE061_009433 [Apolygus lucorum]